MDQEITEVTKSMVSREIEGDASPEELAFLDSNLREWKSELVTMKKEIELSFANVKSKHVGSQKAEFIEWKKEFLEYKFKIEKKLSKIKIKLISKSQDDQEFENKEKRDFQAFILEELFEIKNSLVQIKDKLGVVDENPEDL